MNLRKPKHIRLEEFLPWTSAHFQTQDFRDRFLEGAATLSANDVEVGPMPEESRGALVRWRPGHFLTLNDLVHAHGGRVVAKD